VQWGIAGPKKGIALPELLTHLVGEHGERVSLTGYTTDPRLSARTFSSEFSAQEEERNDQRNHLGYTKGVMLPAETDAWEDVEMRKVVVPCERMEVQSEAVVVVDWTEVRAESGNEHGSGCGATAGGMGGGGAARLVLVREWEELMTGSSVGFCLMPTMLDDAGISHDVGKRAKENEKKGQTLMSSLRTDGTQSLLPFPLTLPNSARFCA